GNNRAGNAGGTSDDRPYATVAGGYGNVASGSYAAVAGGYGNDATATQATVAGGVHNDATGDKSFVGGGEGNTALGIGSVVGGGAFNTASGTNAVVPGGAYNEAIGNYSFAAGQRARALTVGTFVWADSQPYNWAIFDPDGWDVRATGGVLFSVAVNGTGGSTVFCFLDADSNGWVCSDIRPRPDNLTTVNGSEVLQRLSQVPISTWSTTHDDRTVRHIGPQAPDLYAAFGLGEDEQSLNALDMNGIAFAAIQGLYQMLQEAQNTNQALAAQNAGQQAQLDKLSSRLAALEQALGQSR
ncbi:MAG: hypothetical protein WBR35_10850, partial [Anaerolineae bacterium]